MIDLCVCTSEWWTGRVLCLMIIFILLDTIRRVRRIVV